KPRLDLYELSVHSRFSLPALASFHTPHQGKGDYWSSPQRSQLSGWAWQNPQRRFLVLPGNMGFSDVHSTKVAGSCRLHHTLVWKYRWLKLKEHMRTYRPSMAAKSLYRP
ncbi:hypothetical protein P4O66_013258, partial [Electrophorus voltai]